MPSYARVVQKRKDKKKYNDQKQEKAQIYTNTKNKTNCKW